MNLLTEDALLAACCVLCGSFLYLIAGIAGYFVVFREVSIYGFASPLLYVYGFGVFVTASAGGFLFLVAFRTFRGALELWRKNEQCEAYIKGVAESA